MNPNYSQLWNLLRAEPEVRPSDSFWDEALPALDRHNLVGLVYSERSKTIPVATAPRYREIWQRQNIRNSLYQEELRVVGEFAVLAGIKLGSMKGASLLETIYGKDISARSMHDLDLLVAEEDQHALCQFLVARGYRDLATSQWSANAFKRNFSRYHHGVELAVEVHTRLLWREPLHFQWEKTESLIPGIFRLAKEDELVYLTAHLGYQHTFLHLGWLVDIDRLLRHYAQGWNWDRVLQVVQELGVRNSFFGTLHAASRFLSTPLPDELVRAPAPWMTYLIREKFLWNPNGNRILYYILKHRLKDHLWESLKYDLLWAKNRLSENEN